VRERLFEPLGMKYTGFSCTAGKIGRLATSVLEQPRDGRDERSTTRPRAVSGAARPAFPSAAGGLDVDRRRLPRLRPDAAEPRPPLEQNASCHVCRSRP